MISDFKKKDLRTKLKEIRANISANNADEQIRNNFLQNITLTAPAIIATYTPINSEVDVGKLNRALGYCGHQLALPCIENNQMIFREWGINTELVTNKFGINQPNPKSQILNPKYVIVPMLGFNTSKFRLGYGGGFYDRYFASNPNAIKIGVAYNACLTPENFQESFDIPMNIVITENEVYK